MTSMLPTYRRPPVDEVVCGLRFEFLRKLRITHVGLLWQAFGDEFPKVEHASPIVSDVDAIVVDHATGASLPRAWFISASDDYLIQFQGDHFLFNWRRRDGEYPRYATLFPRFKQYLARFLQFVEERGLGPIIPVNWELTYVNHILSDEDVDPGATWSPAFTDFGWTNRDSRFLPRPKAVLWQASFALPRDFGSMTVKARPARRKSDETSLVVLELIAKGMGSDRSLESRDEWFACAHEWIVRGFADLIPMEIQRNIMERIDGF